MLWLKRFLRFKAHLIAWTGVSLLLIWLTLVIGLQLIAARPHLLYGLAEMAGAKLTIERFDSQTHPLATSISLSLEGVSLAWASGSLDIRQLKGDVNLWNLLMPDLALGKQMQISDMTLTLVADDHAPSNSEHPLSSPWLRFWEQTHINHARVIWQAESPWRLEDIQLTLEKDKNWQATLSGNWHYPGFEPMPLNATANIEHFFGFNPKASFTASLNPSQLDVLGQVYHASMQLAGTWDADALRAKIAVQVAETQPDHAVKQGLNQVIGDVRSEDLLAWEMFIQEVQLNGTHLALPVWPKLSIHPQQGVKLELNQVQLGAKDAWTRLLPTEALTAWQDWQPELWIRQLAIKWTATGQLDNIRGGIDILRWQAQPLFPGMDLRDISFAYNPQDGRLQIIPAGGSDQLSLWQQDKPLHVKTTPLVLVFDPTKPMTHWQLPLWQLTIGDLNLRLAITQHAHTQIHADLDAPNINTLVSLLPAQTLDPDLHRWLKTALVKGEKPQIGLDYQGDMAALLSGEWTDEQLKLTGSISGLHLAFDPDYPPLTDADVSLNWRQDGLHILGERAKLGDIQLSQLKTSVLFLPEERIALRVNGDYRATLAQVKTLLLKSKLAKEIGMEETLNTTKLTGQAQGKLALWLPLDGYADTEPVKVLGSARIKQGTWQDAQLDIQDIDTSLLFTEKGIDIPRLQGRWQSGLVKGRIKQESKGLRFLLEGTTPLNMAQMAEGEVTWKSNIMLQDTGQIEVTATGQSQRLARLLPSPFAQTKGISNDWKLSLTHKGNALQIYWQDKDWSITSKLKQQAQAWQIEQLHLLPNTLKTKPEAAIYAHLPSLDLMTWLDWYDKLPNTEDSAFSLPSLGKLYIGQLTLANQRYPKVHIDWQQKSGSPLRLDIKGEGIVGTFVQDSTESSRIHLSRLRWQQPYQTATDKLAAPLPTCAAPDNKQLSELNLRIDELDLITERPEGIQLTPLTNLSTRLFQQGNLRYLSDLTFSYKTLTAEGAWMWHKQRNQSHLFLNAKADKAEHFAALFGLESSLDGGGLGAQVFTEWQGGLDCLDMRTLTAKMTLLAKNGTLAETSPGIARLFGLLSFDAFTRRLKLGLGDVTSAGLVYDRLSVDAQINKGRLQIDDMSLKGPSINMALAGNTDLISETYQLKAQVTPLIGDSIPTIALLSGVSPVTAIGVYLLQKIIPPLSGNILSFDYDITGNWQQPELKSSESKTAQ